MEYNISNVIDRAWEFAKKDGLLLAVIIFGIGIVSSTICSLMGLGPNYVFISELQSHHFNTPEELIEILKPYYVSAGTNSVVQNIVKEAIEIGVVAMVLNIVRGLASKLDFNAYKLPLMTYVKYIGTEFIVNIIVAIGFCLCFIPGLLLKVRLQFASIYLLENPEAGIGDAFSASWNMTSGHFWSLLGLGIIACLILLAGALCCCVGIFFAAAVVQFMFVVAYSMLNPAIAAPTEPEPTIE